MNHLIKALYLQDNLSQSFLICVAGSWSAFFSLSLHLCFLEELCFCCLDYVNCVLVKVLISAVWKGVIKLWTVCIRHFGTWLTEDCYRDKLLSAYWENSFILVCILFLQQKHQFDWKNRKQHAVLETVIHITFHISHFISPHRRKLTKEVIWICWSSRDGHGKNVDYHSSRQHKPGNL